MCCSRVIYLQRWGRNTHVQRGWSLISKPCLDYSAELGVPKSRYRNNTKVGAMTESTRHRGNRSHRFFILFPAACFISCLYIMLLLHLLISNLSHFVATFAEPVNWFLHLHKRHLKCLVSYHTWPVSHNIQASVRIQTSVQVPHGGNLAYEQTPKLQCV